tara:strand:- start:1793 stop:2647 length:855 start_codon:yes stop_codon:yes gene_type:complete
MKFENLDQWIHRIEKRIKFILITCSKWKLKPIFVCDAGYTTEEVQNKWKMRREKELQRGIRKIPYCADTIVCEIILKKNLHLVFDKRYNADDIVATIANMNQKSYILSRDMDYFRYDQGILSNRIFFIDSSRKISQLIHKGATREPLQTIRMYFPIFATSYYDLVKIVECGKYIRGTAYPLAEKSRRENLHLATRQYRRTMYKETVKEIFPILENNIVKWINEDVEPKVYSFPESINALTEEIIQKVQGCNDHKHKTTITIMAGELIAAKNKTSLLDELSKFHI